MAVGSRIDKALRTSHLNKGVALSSNVRYWPKADSFKAETRELLTYSD
jgi:hypothetical protein